VSEPEAPPPPSAPPSRAIAVLGRLALVGVSSLLALGVAEIGYRARTARDETPDGDDGGWRDRYRHMNETIYRASSIEGLVYEPTPSSSVEMEYGAAGFDAAGMRDDEEHALAPDPARTRVAIVGDSIVWSEFLPVWDSLPERVEEALGRQRYEVLPFGVSGYDTTQEAIWYEHAARPFHPAIVVAVWCMNDLVIMSGPFERFATGRDREEKDAQDAWLEEVAPVRRETIDWVGQQREEAATFRVLAHAQNLFERWRFEQHYVDEYLLAFAEPSRRERASRAIARLGAAVASDHARGLFVISPVLEQWDHYRWQALHDFVRDEAERAGFTVLDLREALAGQDPETLRIGGDNLHYGRTGTRTIAAEIAEAIDSLSPSP
jgi:lysophospholipase L1-like esterase